MSGATAANTDLSLKQLEVTSMSNRILLIAILSVLSGCEHVSGCQYGIAPHSVPSRCMTRVEYKAERQKLQKSQDRTPPKGEKQTDPRYEKWIP